MFVFICCYNDVVMCTFISHLLLYYVNVVTRDHSVV
jgi:hypothetical protein